MSESLDVQQSCVKPAVAGVGQREAWRGLSAAAARTGLYAGHEVKQELIVGPEVLQLPDFTFSVEVKQEAAEPVTIKMEPTTMTMVKFPVAVKIEPVAKDPEFVTIKQEPSSCEETFSGDRQQSEGNLGQMLQIKSDRAKPEYILGDNGSPLTATCNEQIELKSNQYSINSAAETNKEIKTSKTNKVNINMKKYSCPICKKQFKYTQSLNAHKLIHTGKKPYNCDYCKKPFRKKSDLLRHKRIHESDKPYSCDICKKQFAEASGLTRHKRIHTGQKPYSCEICQKQFPQAASLRRHKRSHTGESPYSCEFCEKQFVDVSNYKRHKRSHTGEKPYTCEICNKQFADASYTKRHARIHTGEKPYSCEICEKQFACRDNLKQHERSHTKDKT